MSDEEQDIFNAVAASLGAQRDERPSGEQVKAFHFGEGELQFFFTTDWRDNGKARITASVPHGWGGGHANAPFIGFSMHRSPEALAKDIQRRWLDEAKAWHRKQLEAKEAAEKREAQHRERVEALLEANGSGLDHDDALRMGNTYEGHGIAFDGYDISGQGCHGYKVTVAVRDRAMLYEIARIAGGDFRAHAAAKDS
jgi:hypothetical protein